MTRILGPIRDQLAAAGTQLIELELEVCGLVVPGAEKVVRFRS